MTRRRLEIPAVAVTAPETAGIASKLTVVAVATVLPLLVAVAAAMATPVRVAAVTTTMITAAKLLIAVVTASVIAAAGEVLTPACGAIVIYEKRLQRQLLRRWLMTMQTPRLRLQSWRRQWRLQGRKQQLLSWQLQRQQ